MTKCRRRMRLSRPSTGKLSKPWPFLQDLTAYNVAIAHYALATLPASLSADELVSKLVVGRSTKREA